MKKFVEKKCSALYPTLLTAPSLYIIV
jgi:hypothetical protein